MSNRRRASRLALPLLLVTMASGQDFDLSWYTIDGGGGMFVTGGDFELSGTVGQADAGAASGGTYELSGGFWFPTPPTDCNADGAVSLLDHHGLQLCLTGPADETGADCRCYDVDRDGDVDLRDAAGLLMAFTGS